MPYNNVPASQTAKMDRCVQKVMRRGKGMDKSRAIAICHASVVGKKEKELADLTEEESSILKEISTEEQEKEKELETKGFVPYGVKSFQELKAYREARDAEMEVMQAADDLMGLTLSVIQDPAVPDKGKAVVALAQEFAGIVETEVSDVGDGESENEDKAVWTTSYVNNLPDSAFLYVEPGEKDGEGKTVPRSKRHLPYKDSSGKVDLAHVRNAIARIPQMKGVSSGKKSALQERARKILSSAQKEQSETIISKAWGKIRNLFMEAVDEENGTLDDGGMMIWKEATTGQYQWIARYSNNFRDDDNPPEIISTDSHKKFVDMVDKGIAPLPELWIWHVPEWKVGYATALAYDETGFAIATGYFDKGKEHIAEWLSKQNDVLVSHGMPPWSIKRDEEDPSIIIEHQTAEISPLPGWAAANKITGFVVINTTKEEDMIPGEKRKALIERWKIDPSILEELESQNKLDAQKATSEGRESKEIQDGDAKVKSETETNTETETVTQETDKVEDTQVEEKTEEEKTVPVAEEKPVSTDMANYPTREEIADAFGTILGEMRGQIETLSGAVLELTKEMSQMKQSDEEKIAIAAKEVPAASLAAMLSRSIIGNKEAAIDGRSQLGKDKPKEAEPVSDSQIGIPFIDRMVSSERR